MFTNRIVTFTNLQGQSFRLVQLVRGDQDGLIWRDGASGGRICYTNLHPDLLEYFGIPSNRVVIARARAEQKAIADAHYRSKWTAESRTNLLTQAASTDQGFGSSSAYTGAPGPGPDWMYGPNPYYSPTLLFVPPFDSTAPSAPSALSARSALPAPASALAPPTVPAPNFAPAPMVPMASSALPAPAAPSAPSASPSQPGRRR